MHKTYLIGIDVGTSSAKVTLINAKGKALATASRVHPTYSPKPGYQEQDADDWWRGVCDCIREIFDKSGTDPGDIVGLSLSGQGCACLPVNAAGEPLTRAYIWTDARASRQKQHIRQIYGRDLGPFLGNDIYDQPEPRMIWLRDNAPEIYNRTTCFLSTVSYLLFRLTGEFGANISDWGFHLAFDRIRKDWNQEFLKEVGLTSEKFPTLYSPHQIAGYITQKSAAECGLIVGTPVVAGGQDAIEPGQSIFMRGTTDLLCICSEHSKYHPDLYTTCAVLPGLYMSYDMKDVIASGGAYRWLAKMLFDKMYHEKYEEMNRLAASSAVGSNGLVFLPYMLMTTTPDPDRERAGMFFGVSVDTKREDFCRSVMEGTAFALRETINRMKRASIVVKELRPTGGPTRSRLWNQITANVIDLPIILPAVSDGAAYGAALLAGLGVGVFPMDDGFKKLQQIIRQHERYEPEAEVRTDYDHFYEVFLELAQATSGIAARVRGE
jgi:xylulokinase